MTFLILTLKLALTNAMHQRGVAPMPFELMVLDTALDVVVRWFWSYFLLVRKVLKKIIDDSQTNPSDLESRRILAFKKSIVVFGNRVETAKEVFKLFSWFYLVHVNFHYFGSVIFPALNFFKTTLKLYFKSQASTNVQACCWCRKFC